VGANGREKRRMREGQMKGAVSTHGNAGNGAIGAAGADAVVGGDEGKKFAQKEIFVTALAVEGVDVEAGAPRGSSDEEFLEKAFVAEIFDEVPGAGVKKGLFVVAEAMEEIQNREAAGFVGVKAGRQKNAVGDGVREDFAGDGVALDAAGSSECAREVKEIEEVNEEKEKADHSTAG